MVRATPPLASGRPGRRGQLRKYPREEKVMFWIWLVVAVLLAAVALTAASARNDALVAAVIADRAEGRVDDDDE
jgi:hypothetical protein